MSLKGNTTAEKIWNFLISKGLNECGAAGLMGNLKAESALKPTNLQQTYEKKLGHTDDSYTVAVDAGNYTNFVNDSAGYGLAQWTYWSRKEKLLNYARSCKASIGDLEMQLCFLWKELSESYGSVLTSLKNAKTIREASDAVLLRYECPANQGTSVQQVRAAYGQEFFDQFAAKNNTRKDQAPQTPQTWTPKVGDVVNYSGSTHYTSANSSGPKACKGGKAKITQIYQLGKSKHPYHLVRVSGSGATVYGWVDAGTFTKA